MKKCKRFVAGVMSMVLAVAVLIVTPVEIEAKYGTKEAVAEYLDRGISAIKTGSGMLVSWRFLASDDDKAVFKLYRNDTLIYTSNAGQATCYLDKSGNASSKYRVDTLVNGEVTSTSDCGICSNGDGIEIELDRPSSIYTPNDCTVGDVDGDGVYEIFVKWDPNNSKDNSQSGKTDKVYIDCYKLDGTKLWRIDLGVNIRAGAHYTQFLVADFDNDGYAEMTCKTGDGTVDGQGNVIGNASKDYRNSRGYILTGPEYYTLFDGLTGKALDTVNYNPERGKVSLWGDSYGNRVDRFLGAVAYLDGKTPYAVTVRGYYTRLTACAYKVENDKLVEEWFFDTGNASSADGYGDGNHNCMPADVDDDGRQEIVFGSLCLDDDGTVLWNLNTGHGDAMHLGDLLPDNDGLELWICHEAKPYGVTLVDTDKGSKIFHINGDGDTGRCCAGNVWSGNDGAEFWGLGNTVYNGSGVALSCSRPDINFLIYWDGDLEREILNGYTDSPATIKKMQANGKITTLLSTEGYYTCNTTKGTPCLSADIFGDWREELIVRAADGNSIRIFSTTYETDYRITTLMHDIQYRTQVAGQNVAYNQPPHTSYYLGSEQALPQRPAVTVIQREVIEKEPVTAEIMDTSFVYMFKNKNSNLAMDVEGAVQADGTNVQQWGGSTVTKWNSWVLEACGDGYYKMVSQIGDGKSFYMAIADGSGVNGANACVWSAQASDAQMFKFVKNPNGSYTIYTKASNDKCVLEVMDASTGSGGNVQQATANMGVHQQWLVEVVGSKETAVPTATPVPTSMPTEPPSEIPTENPSEAPTESPSEVPTEIPSEVPTEFPSEVPTEIPSEVPTEIPSEAPTEVPSAVPQETVEPTFRPPIKRYYMGDANVDGKVTAADALCVLKHVVKLEQIGGISAILGDIDESKRLESIDALGILKVVVKLSELTMVEL